MRRVFVVSILSFLSVFVYGQNDFKPEWNVGFGFGTTLSNISFERNPSSFNPDAALGSMLKTKNDLRYMGGISIRYISEKHLGMIAELNYSQQGWAQDLEDFNLENVGNDFEYKHYLDYIELPILTHIYWGNKTRFFINLGPKFGYLIGDSEKINESLANYLSSFPEENQPDLLGKVPDHKFDYGLLVGGGLELRSKIGHFALEGRYNLSLSDIYKSKKTEPFSRSANRVISVKLTYYTKLF